MEVVILFLNHCYATDAQARHTMVLCEIRFLGGANNVISLILHSSSYNRPVLPKVIIHFQKEKDKKQK